MKKAIPSSAKFLLCEDLRPETNNKITIIGLYPADKVFVLPLKEPNKLPPNAVAVLPQLTIVVFLLDGEGVHAVNVIVRSASGKVLFEGTTEDVQLTQGLSATLFFRGLNVIIPEFGRYTAEIGVSGKVFSYQFEVTDEPLPALLRAEQRSRSPARKKSKPSAGRSRKAKEL